MFLGRLLADDRGVLERQREVIDRAAGQGNIRNAATIRIASVMSAVNRRLLTGPRELGRPVV